MDAKIQKFSETAKSGMVGWELRAQTVGHLEAK